MTTTQNTCHPDALNALRVADNSPAAMDRRRFIQGALLLGSGVLGSTLFPSGARAAAPLGETERILVIVTMGGGNDGLGMIAPLDNGYFMSTRGQLAGDRSTAHAIDGGLYLDENLSGIKSLYDQGRVACVLGVGNPTLDHSHFTSMASWMAGDTTALPKSGWLGRYAEAGGANELALMSIASSGVPLLLRTRQYMATAVSPWGTMFGSERDDSHLRKYDLAHAYAAAPSGYARIDEVATTLSGAIDVAEILEPAYVDPTPTQGLIRDMNVAARLINVDVGARVIGVELGSFDHHSGQEYPQQVLMAEIDAAVSEFYATLDPAFADRVAIMTYSEFGRSFTTNGSVGTDHGTASNVLLIGNQVRGGLHGEYPSLTDLDATNDVKHTVDFRSYYASVLDGWLGADSTEILGRQFEDLNLFDSGAVVEPTPTPTPVESPTPTPTPTPPSNPTGTVLVRINCGGAAMTALDGGADWEEDSAANNHRFLFDVGDNRVSRFPNITASDDSPDTLPPKGWSYQRWNRTGGFGYQIPIPIGRRALVRVFTGNGWSGTAEPGQRQFDIRIDSVKVEERLDLSATLGHAVGGVFEYEAVSDGRMQVSFRGKVQRAVVSALEVVLLD